MQKYFDQLGKCITVYILYAEWKVTTTTKIQNKCYKKLHQKYYMNYKYVFQDVPG